MTITASTATPPVRSRSPVPAATPSDTSGSPAAAPASRAPITATARTPIAASAPTAAARQPTAEDMSWGARGADQGRALYEREQVRHQQRQAERALQREMPFRFKLFKPKPGTLLSQADIIILDAAPDWWAYEHDLTFEPPFAHTNNFGKKQDVYVTCPHEFESCPICETRNSDGRQRQPYYGLFLTIQDLRGKEKDGVKVEPHMMRLLVVKPEQQGFFLRLYERHGTLRGIQLLMTRDLNTKSQIGNPEFLAIHPEQAILDTFGHDEVKDPQSGAVLKSANQDCYPLQYGRFMPRPSAAAIRERFAHLNIFGAPPAGSREELANEWGDDRGQPAPGIQPQAQPRPAPAAGGIQARAQHVQVPDDPDDIPF